MSRLASAWRRDRVGTGALCFLVLLVVVAVLAPWLAPHALGDGDVRNTLSGPSTSHWLGTDSFGRDILSELIYGTRTAVIAVVVALAITVGLGGIGGLIAGSSGRLVDGVLSRVSDAAMALPGMVLAIAVVAVLGQGLSKVLIALGLMLAPRLLRIVRAATIGVRDETYITNARSLALSRRRILVRHIVPNVLPAAISQLSVMAAIVLVAEASLSFLGLGAQPPTASWGVMISEAAGTMRQTWWPLVPPGIALVCTVLALHYVGDSVSDRVTAGATHLPNAARHPRRASPASASHPEAIEGRALLTVRDLEIQAPYEDGTFGPVVTDVSFDLAAGEVLALIGESGSGKTVTGLAVTGLLPRQLHVSRGSIRLAGAELLDNDEDAWASIRGSRIAMIFQEPTAALNPAMTIGAHLAEVLRLHGHHDRAHVREHSVELLARVGILDPQRRLGQYPHQVSGGMAQRIMIALALAAEPQVLIADEPTTALDVTVQARVLDVLRDIVERERMGLLIITHDVGVVADVADRVAVMYAGEIVEAGTTRETIGKPAHPYTQALIRSMPDLAQRGSALTSIPGAVPAPWAWPTGCRFRERCPHAHDVCTGPTPRLHATPGEHATACLLAPRPAPSPSPPNVTIGATRQ